MPLKEGIESFTGHPGSGKTYAMISKLYNHIKTKKYRYKPIYSNMKLNVYNLRKNTGWKGDFIYLNQIEQLTYIHDGIVIIDEMHVWCPSADWEKINKKYPQLKADWSQIRKEDLMIMITSQAFQRIYNVIREIVHTNNEMTSVKGMGYFVAKVKDVEVGVIEKKGTPNFIKFKKEIAACYDTKEKIQVPIGFQTEKTKEQIEKEKKIIESITCRTKEQIIKDELKQQEKEKQAKWTEKKQKELSKKLRTKFIPVTTTSIKEDKKKRFNPDGYFQIEKPKSNYELAFEQLFDKKKKAG